MISHSLSGASDPSRLLGAASPAAKFSFLLLTCIGGFLDPSVLFCILSLACSLLLFLFSTHRRFLLKGAAWFSLPFVAISALFYFIAVAVPNLDTRTVIHRAFQTNAIIWASWLFVATTSLDALSLTLQQCGVPPIASQFFVGILSRLRATPQLLDHMRFSAYNRGLIRRPSLLTPRLWLVLIFVRIAVVLHVCEAHHRQEFLSLRYGLSGVPFVRHNAPRSAAPTLLLIAIQVAMVAIALLGKRIWSLAL